MDTALAPRETRTVGRDEPPPYRSYAGIFLTFTGGLTAAAALGRALDREEDGDWLDFAVLTLATFKAAHTLAHDEVTSWLRAPFVEGEADGEREEPQGQGLRRALGELVTCTRCAGTWAAAGLISAQLVAPRFGKLLNWSLAVAGANDVLQSGFAMLRAKANELEESKS